MHVGCEGTVLVNRDRDVVRTVGCGKQETLNHGRAVCKRNGSVHAPFIDDWDKNGFFWTGETDWYNVENSVNLQGSVGCINIGCIQIVGRYRVNTRTENNLNDSILCVIIRCNIDLLTDFRHRNQLEVWPDGGSVFEDTVSQIGKHVERNRAVARIRNQFNWLWIVTVFHYDLVIRNRCYVVIRIGNAKRPCTVENLHEKRTRLIGFCLPYNTILTNRMDFHWFVIWYVLVPVGFVIKEINSTTNSCGLQKENLVEVGHTFRHINCSTVGDA